MRTRVVVLAVAALLAVAVADAIRSHIGVASPPPARSPTAHVASLSIPPVEAVYAQEHVVRSGRVVLSPEQIDHGFPSSLTGPFTIRDMVVAHDGMLAVDVIRYPPALAPHGAIELWRRGRLVRAFAVDPELLAGGLGTGGPGRFLAAYSAGRSRVTYFDRRGNPVESLRLR